MKAPKGESVIYAKEVLAPSPERRKGGIYFLVTQEVNCAVVWRLDEREEGWGALAQPDGKAPVQIIATFGERDPAIDHAYEQATAEIVARKLAPDMDQKCDCTQPISPGKWCEEPMPGGRHFFRCSRPPGHEGDHVACNRTEHGVGRWTRAGVLITPLSP